MSTVVLASRSPARAQLLRAAGVEVEVRPADLDEAAVKRQHLAAGQTADAVALALAQAKAMAVRAEATQTVIGADQTLELDGILFDKPETLAEAGEQLRRLRGRRHRLHSAVVASRDGTAVWCAISSVDLQVRAFSDAFLDRYLAAEGEALLGCVGAYRLEGWGAQLFERIEGDYFTVLGLPLLPLLGFLRDAGEMAE